MHSLSLPSSCLLPRASLQQDPSLHGPAATLCSPCSRSFSPSPHPPPAPFPHPAPFSGRRWSQWGPYWRLKIHMVFFGYQRELIILWRAGCEWHRDTGTRARNLRLRRPTPNWAPSQRSLRRIVPPKWHRGMRISVCPAKDSGKILGRRDLTVVGDASLFLSPRHIGVSRIKPPAGIEPTTIRLRSTCSTN